jgi:membrane carboxypeptidase/penicillin-binding protein PbpC
MPAIPLAKLPKYDRIEFNENENKEITMELIKDSNEPGWFINGRKLTDGEYREMTMKLNMSNAEINTFNTMKETKLKENKALGDKQNENNKTK